MIDETFERLSDQVKTAPTLSERQKRDVTNYLSKLNTFLVPFAEEHPEAAQSICNFINCVIYESTRKSRTNPLATTARKGMLLSFHPFEETHQEMVSTAYEFGDVLSALGI